MVHDCFEGMTVLAFDLETTGISARSDRIVQYAFVGSDSDGNQIRVEELVDPGISIPMETTRIHGIHTSDVRGMGKFSSHAETMADMIEGAVIVGHNVRRFDMEFVNNEFLRLGRKAPQPLAVIDTLEVVRRLRLPRPHRLGALCDRHGIDLTNAHTAGADAAATLLLLWRLMNDHPSGFRRPVEEIERWLTTGDGGDGTDDSLGRGIRDLEPVDRQGRLRRDGEDIVLAFGRHRASTLRQVAKVDPRYLDWLMSQASLLDEDCRDEVKEHISGFSNP